MRLFGGRHGVRGSNKGDRSSNHLTNTPIFEELEPRLLLSGDGLGAVLSDPLDSFFDQTPAIEIDFDYGQVQTVSVVEDSQEVDSQLALVDESEDSDSSLNTEVKTGETLSEIVDLEVIIDSASSSDVSDASLTNNEQPISNDIIIDSQTTGSIETRGPPTEIVFIDSSLNLDIEFSDLYPFAIVNFLVCSYRYVAWQ